MQGFVEAVLPFEVRGWAYDEGAPDSSVEIIIRDDGGKTLAIALANLFREDLIAGNIGNGHHAFVVPITWSPEVTPAGFDVCAKSSEGLYTVLQQLKAPPSSDGQPNLLPAATWCPAVCDPSHTPVFLVGSARTGSTTLMSALLKASDYAGCDDGHLLDLLGALRWTVEKFFEDRSEETRRFPFTLISQCQPSYFFDCFNIAAIQFARSKFPEGRWIDKNLRPEFISMIGVINEIWPRSRFIFMKRRGIENIVSRMRKFTHYSFQEHCRDWANIMSLWASSRPIVEGRYIELDQYDMLNNPAKVAQDVAIVLGLSPPQQTKLFSLISSGRHERSAGNPVLGGLEAAGWDNDQKEQFVQLCSAEMDRYGYSLDSSYFKE